LPSLISSCMARSSRNCCCFFSFSFSRIRVTFNEPFNELIVTSVSFFRSLEPSFYVEIDYITIINTMERLYLNLKIHYNYLPVLRWRIKVFSKMGSIAAIHCSCLAIVSILPLPSRNSLLFAIAVAAEV